MLCLQNYGGDIHAAPLYPQVEALQVVTLWLPLVPVDHTTGALSLVKGSHRQGKIWPATIVPEERDPLRETTFSDLVPRPTIAERRLQQGLHDYKSLNWPQGVAKFGEVVSPTMQPGDALAFHNLLMHGRRNHCHTVTHRAAG